ncbi:MAG: hotdog fold domain-containing protein [Hellea sp.]
MHQFQQIHQAMGDKAFTQQVVNAAPYFGSIDPILTKLESGCAEVLLKNQKKIHNHIGTVHAIAMCNAAELAAGMATTVSIPENSRWIAKGMTVVYLVKAKTDLRVVTEATEVDFSIEGDVIVPVAAYDEKDVKVFTAQITMNVKHN